MIFTSCNSNEAETVDNEKSNETVNESPRSLINDNSADNPSSDGSATKEDMQSAPMNIAPKTNRSVTINPPHGEPGHDCAVKVGDPLPSSSNSAAPVFNNPQNNGSVKLNPPHGQPGHDCAVKVGDPLNW